MMKNHKIKINGVWNCSASLHEKKITRKTIEWCIKNLGLSRLKKLNINVSIKTLKDCYGYCEEISHKDRKYNIVISNNQHLRYFVMTIIHEMIHIKQYIRNEWSGDGEQEALINEGRLSNKLWEDNIL